MKSDIEIARSIELKKIKQVAEGVGIPREEVENYGRYIAKIPEQLIDEEKVKKKQSHSGHCYHSNQSGHWQNYRIYRSCFGTE